MLCSENLITTYAMTSSNTDFSESQLVTGWLDQFDAGDKEVARQLCRRLRLVSHREFEDGLRHALTSVLNNSGAKRVAAIPVTEAPPYQDPNNPEKRRRSQADSSNRIGQLLTNMERATNGKLYANPTVESMRAERIRHIVLVDDHIGTGNRLCDFWKERMHASIKSWLSRKWTKLWLVTFSASQGGLFKARGAIRALHADQIITATPAVWNGGLNKAELYVAEKYGRRTRKASAAYGYGSSATLIVFEHSCPNNSPVMFWEGGRNWRPLFPNRGIPSQLTKYFGETTTAFSAEVLWTAGQFRLAISLIDDIESGTRDLPTWRLLSLIGLISKRPTVTTGELQANLRMTIETFEDTWTRCLQLQLIDNIGQITPFGRDVLRIKRLEIPKKDNPRKLVGARRPYYPTSAGGAFRV